jgi:hypothetical protein
MAFLAEGSYPLAETKGRARWLPNDEPPLPAFTSPGVIGASEFLDPLIGWLGAVNDLESILVAEPCQGQASRADSPDAHWLPWPPTPPLGVSFVWERPVSGEFLAKVVLATPKDESLWILSDDDAFSLSILQAARQAGRPVLVLGPALAAELKEYELGGLIEAKERQHARAVAQLRTQLDDLRERERKTQANLGKWQELHSLELDLEKLSREVQNRQKTWTLAQEELTSAQDRWAELQPSQSFWSFLKRKSPQAREKAQKQLENAEFEMARVRREQRDLLVEAKRARDNLTNAERSVSYLPGPEELSAKRQTLSHQIAELSQQIGDKANSFSRLAETQAIWAGQPVTLVFPGWAKPSSWPEKRPIDNLLVIAPRGHDDARRRELASLANWPTKRLMVVADFTSWSWLGGDFDLKTRPWNSFLAPKLATALTSASPISTSALSTELHLSLPLWVSAAHPDQFPWLAELGVANPINAFSCSGPWGPVWRAVGEVGPFNPVSALASVHLALAARKLAGTTDQILLLAPSPAQGALLRALIQDLAPHVQGLAAGEPAELADWPGAALVIMDTALGLEHPWAWRESGRTATLQALAMAQGAVCLLGDQEVINQAPPDSPLVRLWNQAAQIKPSFHWPPATAITMWEALNKAKNEAFFCLPPFEPAWWTPLSIHFQSALNRQVKITILAQTPEPEQRKYADTVIRDLKLFGAQVALAQGFPDLMGLIDQKYFAWGWPGRFGLGHDWNHLWTLELPLASPWINQVIQATLLSEKLGPRGFRHCPLCGWPYVVINQAKAQDFQRRQPLRLGCLNPACPIHQQPRRLDERWPFLNAPICPKDQKTPYIRQPKGRGEIWVCPSPAHDCPPIKVIPGDINPRQ